MKRALTTTCTKYGIYLKRGSYFYDGKFYKHVRKTASGHTDRYVYNVFSGYYYDTCIVESSCDPITGNWTSSASGDRSWMNWPAYSDIKTGAGEYLTVYNLSTRGYDLAFKDNDGVHIGDDARPPDYIDILIAGLGEPTHQEGELTLGTTGESVRESDGIRDVSEGLFIWRLGDEFTDGELSSITSNLYMAAAGAIGGLQWGGEAAASTSGVSIRTPADLYDGGSPGCAYRWETHTTEGQMYSLQLGGVDYRLVATTMGPTIIRWYEVTSLATAGGGTSVSYKEYSERIMVGSGGAATATHHIEPPAQEGSVTICIPNRGISVGPPESPSGLQCQILYLDSSLNVGQVSRLDITLSDSNNDTPSSVIVTWDGDLDSIDLIAVDPTTLQSAGLRRALENGVLIASGCDLMRTANTPGLNHEWNSSWPLFVLGKKTGTIDLKIQAHMEKAGPIQDLTRTVSVLSAPELALDANRDGEIKLPSADDSDATSADKPFRFWLNDDDDRQHTVDGSDSEEDDLGGGEQIGLKADCLEDRPQSKRDLEDYARLWISTQGLNSAFKDETNPLYLGLQWTDTNGTTPAIKIVKHVETDGGTKYLTDDTVAQQQYTAAGAIQGITNTYPNLTLVDASDTDGRFFVLPKSLFSDLSETAPKTYLLFEGVQVGKGQLRLVILKKDGSTYTKIGDGPGVWMDLKKIEDFYERWTVGDTDGGTPWSAAVRKKTTIAANGNVYSYSDGFAYASDAPEEMKYILYVHGWNMQAWEKNRFAETAFKRLYWQGYKGRFGVFCWPSTYSFEPPLSAILDGTNYDQGEWAAWKSATPLKDLLVSLNGTYGGQVNVMAHSMGNVVTGEALRLASQQGTGQIVRAYVASQAAVPAHCYDGARSEDIAAVFGFWTSIGRFFDGSTQLPNVYPDWLTSNGAATGRRVNFYNVNDYALWHDVWELNQAFKPDRPDGSAQPWYYGYEDNLGAPPTLHSSFIRFDHYNTDADPVGIEERQLGTQAAVGDRYEIMAFASESRTMAVGAAGALPGLRVLDLTGVWPSDNQSVKLHTDTGHPDGLNYSAHKWHSAQFRSTNMRQNGYWKALLDDRGFNLSTTTP
jgi:hypothetical protein